MLTRNDSGIAIDNINYSSATPSPKIAYESEIFFLITNKYADAIQSIGKIHPLSKTFEPMNNFLYSV